MPVSARMMSAQQVEAHGALVVVSLLRHAGGDDQPERRDVLHPELGGQRLALRRRPLPEAPVRSLHSAELFIASAINT